MLRFILAAGLSIISGTAIAQYGYGTGSNPNSHGVSGHLTNSGTYVQPHSSTNPNSTQLDNYGTRGNYNRHTGAYGTRTPR